MNKKLPAVFISLATIACLSMYLVSCTKAAAAGPGYTNITPPTPNCATVNITDSITPASACTSNGAIRIYASGSNGLQFKLGSAGVYQSIDSFLNIPAGTYTVFVKDSAGCETSAVITVTSSSVSINTIVTPSSPCGSDGGINVSATGSTGFMYKVNAGGTYQYSGLFTGLGVGTYTVYAKDTSGCETTASVTIGSGAPGPLFASVDSLMALRCQSCHNNSIQQDGMNWQVHCNIVMYQSLIDYEAVQNSFMPYGGPALRTDEKAIISNWENAGGTYGN